jgi:hypothetical protein
MPSRRASLVLAVALLSGCSHLYHATSPNPALVQVPVVAHGPNVLGIGVADSFDLVAVDGKTMGIPMTDRDFRRIDPGTHRLAVVYQGNKRFLGPNYTSFPLVLNAKLDGGHRYRIVCETTDVSVKGYVRDLGTNKIVSNIAEQSLMLQNSGPSMAPPLVIPVVHH